MEQNHQDKQEKIEAKPKSKCIKLTKEEVVSPVDLNDTQSEIIIESCAFCGITGPCASEQPKIILDLSTMPNLDQVAHKNVSPQTLIKPCLCEIYSHRMCLKAYIMMTNKIQCEKCHQYYLIKDRSKRRKKLAFYGWLILSIIFIGFFGLFAGLLIKLIYDYAIMIGDYQDEHLSILVPVVYIVLESVLLLAVVVFIVSFPFLIASSLKRLKMKAYNFQVYCVETEKSVANLEDNEIAMQSDHKRKEIQKLVEYSKENGDNAKKYEELFKKIKQIVIQPQEV